MLDPSYVADSSTPGTKPMPTSWATAAASPSPSVVSWSVSATTSSPRSRASRTSSAGVNVPSERVEWACRSIPGMGATWYTRRCSGLPAGPRDPNPSAERVLAGERASDDELLDLAGAFVQGRDAGVAQVLPDGVLVDVAVPTVDLHGRVRRPNGDLAREVLGHRRVQSVGFAPVGHGCDSTQEQPRGVHLDRHVGDQLLHQLKPCDRRAEL